MNKFAFYFVSLFCFGSTQLNFASDYLLRAYDWVKDYAQASALCQQHWQLLGENDSFCSHTFEKYLYAITFPFTLPEFSLEALVLESQGELIGLCIYQVTPKGLSAENMNFMEMSYIIIDTKYQRQGYASALFDGVKADLLEQGCKTVFARVQETNIPAIAWHTKQGFVDVEEESNDGLEQTHYLHAKSYGYRFMKLVLAPKSKSRHKSLDSETLLSLKTQLRMRAEVDKITLDRQTRIIKHASVLFHPLIEVNGLNCAQFFKMARYYINASSDANKTMAYIVYLMRHPLNDEEEATFAEIFGLIDIYINLVNEFRKQNKELSFDEALKMADAAYHKDKKSLESEGILL